MTERARLTTSWTPERNWSVLSDHPLPAEASAMDATGQAAENIIPDPNALIVEVWADSAYLDAIDATEPGAILWREPYDATA